MANFSIGLSGLEVAQRAIDLIGTNIANASTPGYHRQELSVVPVDYRGSGGASIGGGAEIAAVRRNLDLMLDNELLAQQPLLGEIHQQLLTMQSVEATLGQVDSEGLSSAITSFFNSLQALAAQPTSQPLRQQAVWTADAMSIHFRNLAKFLADQQAGLVMQTRTLLDQANGLAAEVADLNDQINSLAMRGGNVNLLSDRRDQAITELAELMDCQTNPEPGKEGVTNVIAWGTPLVSGSRSVRLEMGTLADGEIGISVAGANYYMPNVSGGRIGALIQLSNKTLADLAGQVNGLASQIITQVNDLHAQGLGTSGPFTSLAGWAMPGTTLADAGVQGGSLYVRVTAPDGQVSRYGIDIMPAQTLAQVAQSLSALNGIEAAVLDGSLSITADAGYHFDFLPAVLEEPTTSTLTGTATPTFGGAYTGQANAPFRLIVEGSGSVGATDGLSLAVYKSGVLVSRVNVGVGYAAGDPIGLPDGISLALSSGTLTDAEYFDTFAIADSDSSGLLAAAGLNVFFQGNSAYSMRVAEEMMADSSRLATACGADLADNTNILKMAQVGQTDLAALDGATPGEFFEMVVSGVGQQVKVLQARQSSLENINHQLSNQFDQISGVDVNEEAAKLLVFERMFQSMAKFIGAQNEALQALFDLI